MKKIKLVIILVLLTSIILLVNPFVQFVQEEQEEQYQPPHLVVGVPVDFELPEGMSGSGYPNPFN